MEKGKEGRERGKIIYRMYFPTFSRAVKVAMEKMINWLFVKCDK